MRRSCGSTAAIGAALLVAFLLPAAAGAADPGPGYVEVSSNPPGATVYVNQVRMEGVTPLTIPLPANQHQEVMLNLYGYKVARQTVMLQPGQRLPLAFELEILPGGGNLGAETPGAARSPTAPPGEGPTVTQEIWVEETPLSLAAALLAVAGAGLIVARRRA